MRHQRGARRPGGPRSGPGLDTGGAPAARRASLLAHRRLVPGGAVAGQARERPRHGVGGQGREGPPQIGHQVGAGGVAILRRLREGPLENRIHLGRQGRIERRGRARILVQDAVDDRGDRVPLERPRAGQELVQHDAQREEIAASVEVAPLDLLRGHVGRRPEQDTGLGEVRRRVLGEAEVGHLQGAVFQHHQVRRLDVAVHDVILMRIVERRRRLGHHVENARQRQEVPGFGVLLQRLPLDELHGDEGDSGLLADVEDGDDVRVEELPRGLRFAHETLAGLTRFLGRRPGRQDDRLDRDLALDLRIVGQEDLAHRSSADLADDLEATQFGGIHRPARPSWWRWKAPSRTRPRRSGRRGGTPVLQNDRPGRSPASSP